MGDRLVSKISYKGKFLAASYQHWSASDESYLEEILDKIIEKHCFFDDDHERTKEEAAQILYEMLSEYNRFDNPKHGLISSDIVMHIWTPDGLEKQNYHSDEQAELISKGIIPVGEDRSDGFITVDEKISNYWEGWAEAFNNFDWS